ncbi:MAG: type II toxin-antitoxin system VapC family toxin [Proteobacteria bacterium]|nr:type II toxin-antitoxin system VapC family toxin [Pseudomonadota bacterium]
MKYLLDTCVLSELIKPKPNKNVVTWIAAQKECDLYVSVLIFGEINKGIEKAVDIKRKQRLQLWVKNDLYARFKGRIIQIDLLVSNKWGEIQAQTEKIGKPMPSIDGLIVASGLVNNCIVVTRNIADMENSTTLLLNPWLGE